jgi:hypothetical protein
VKSKSEEPSGPRYTEPFHRAGELAVHAVERELFRLHALQIRTQPHSLHRPGAAHGELTLGRFTRQQEPSPLEARRAFR